METVTIRVNNAKAMRLLEDLEEMNLIQVIKRSVVKEKGEKLSERLAGSISTEQADILRKELAQMRNEWERDI